MKEPLKNESPFSAPLIFQTFWKPPLRLKSNLKLSVTPSPLIFYRIFQTPPLKLESEIRAPLNHAEQNQMFNRIKKAVFNWRITQEFSLDAGYKGCNNSCSYNDSWWYFFNKRSAEYRELEVGMDALNPEGIFRSLTRVTKRHMFQ